MASLSVAADQGNEQKRGRDADKPSDIRKKGWKDILIRVKNQLGEHHVSIVAAGVTFYAFLAIFPAIAAVVSLYGLLVDPATVEQQFAQLTDLLPSQAHDLLSGQLKSVASQSSSTLSFGVALSILAATWSAKNGMKSLIEGMNIVYNEKDKRGFLERMALTFVLTLCAVFITILSMTLVIGLPAALGNIRLSEPVALALRVVRWVILGAILLVSLAAVYRFAPDRAHAKWRWVSYGSVIAVVLWLTASSGFSYYVSNFSSYNETYGSLAAVVILLMWLYLSAFIILLGAEINAEMEHQTEKDSTTGPAKPLGERRAQEADTVGEAQG